MVRIKFTFPWLEWGRISSSSSSSSNENKWKEPPVDADNSTAEVPSSRKRKRANAFHASEGSSAAPNKENMTMNIKKTERSCSVQENTNQHYFNEAEVEVAEILRNLNTSFLERLNLETNNTFRRTLTRRPLQRNNAPRVAVAPIRRERTRAVNLETENTFQRTLARRPLQRNNAPRVAVAPIRRERRRAVNPPTTELPENFKNVIRNMGGSEINFVIEKTLCKSDFNRQQNRLSMPSAQINDREFLRLPEIESLDENGGEIKVRLIEPSLEISELILVKWRMDKGNGSVSTSYILRTNWMDVAEANELKKDDVVQVWSFRVQEELCFAIVKL